MPGRRRAALAVAAFIAIGLAGCSDAEPLEPQARHMLVQAVLDAGSNEVTVFVEQTGTSQHTENSAVVTITLPSGQTFNVPRDVTPGVGGYYKLYLPSTGATVVPGGTYGLRVVAALEVATGTTTVPLATPASNSLFAGGLSISRDTLRMSWTAVSGAKGYEVTIQNSLPSQGTSNFEDYSTFIGGTTFTIAGSARTTTDNPVFFSGRTAEITVSAVDDNYYEYYRRITDPLSGAPPSRLTGALGFFGSVVPMKARQYAVVP